MTEPNGLAAALAELQTKLPKIPKAKKANAGTYTYNYADLEDISEKLLPIMGGLGLSFTCWPDVDEQGRFVLRYTILHTSGEERGGTYPLPNGTPQTIGSAISYGRRYCLCAVTGVSPGGDDDGAAAEAHQAAQQRQERPPQQRQAPRQQQPQPPRQRPNGPAGQDVPITKNPKLFKRLQATFKSYGITEHDARVAYAADVIGHDLASTNDLTVGEGSRVLQRLEHELGQGTDVTPPEPTDPDDPWTGDQQ